MQDYFFSWAGSVRYQLPRSTEPLLQFRTWKWSKKISFTFDHNFSLLQRIGHFYLCFEKFLLSWYFIRMYLLRDELSLKYGGTFCILTDERKFWCLPYFKDKGPLKQNLGQLNVIFPGKDNLKEGNFLWKWVTGTAKHFCERKSRKGVIFCLGKW